MSHELQQLCDSPNISGIIKSRRLRLFGRLQRIPNERDLRGDQNQDGLTFVLLLFFSFALKSGNKSEKTYIKCHGGKRLLLTCKWNFRNHRGETQWTVLRSTLIEINTIRLTFLNYNFLFSNKLFTKIKKDIAFWIFPYNFRQ